MTTPSHLTSKLIKETGAHYTPPGLALFLAEAISRYAKWGGDCVDVLDPACGDGNLLSAIAHIAPAAIRHKLRLVGYETDTIAAINASSRLHKLGVLKVDIRVGDFLDMASITLPFKGSSLFSSSHATIERYDIAISNPPYVRTQALGAVKTKHLAKRFGLAGRVDLYHAFIKAISSVLNPSGVLGLITSNRFMLVQSGATIRELFRRDFNLRDLYDLGDTKLFTAAILPALIIAEREPVSSRRKCSFTRVYEIRDHTNAVDIQHHVSDSILDVLRKQHEGDVQTVEGRFRIERGELNTVGDLAKPWSLSSSRTRDWLSMVKEKQVATFGSVAQVRVGIKTTADTIFIRDDWNTLPKRICPEPELLKPLFTHHIAARWRAMEGNHRKVLYPHEEDHAGNRKTINLKQYPRAFAYLEAHRERLESRRYVIEAGRQWFEIWVPQQPRDWQEPKIVYPDISEKPRFFIDRTGAVVNGDCYWITLNYGVPKEYLFLLLAVANSTFITAYYDIVFHNKLYAGRRRFMTQYVREFPLPDIQRKDAKRIVSILAGLPEERSMIETAEDELDSLVWDSFGMSKKVVR